MGLAVPIQAQVQGESGQAGGMALSPQSSPLSPAGEGVQAIPAINATAANAGNAPGEAAPPVRRLWSIVPRITLAETLTDNVAPASGVKRSDQVTEVSPGIRIDGESARLKFHLDYHLRQLLYAQESGRKNTQNYLNSFGTLEAVEKWLFVDVSGVVTQQEISPFRFQTASNTSVNPNRVETSNFRVSPYARGRLAGSADYELRYDRSATRSSSAFAVDIDVDEWRANIKGATPLATLGWGVDASRRNIDYKGGRNNEEDRFRGLLTYRFGPEFRVSATAGQEANNFATSDKETHGTHGYGFEWQPSERTYVSALRENRFFGNGHMVSAGHRTPLTALRFSDSRDVSILPGRFATAGFGTIYDLLFTQFASRVPDPIERQRYVETVLQQFGIAPDVVVTRGFLTSRVAVQRRQELSYSIQWVRDMLTLSAVRTEHEGIGPTAGPTDVFAVSPNIRQRGYNVSYSHRLTPLTSLNVVAYQQISRGAAGTSLSSDLKSLQIGVTTRLGPNTFASLGARRTLFDSTVVLPYTENALVGALTAQF